VVVALYFYSNEVLRTLLDVNYDLVLMGSPSIEGRHSLTVFISKTGNFVQLF